MREVRPDAAAPPAVQPVELVHPKAEGVRILAPSTGESTGAEVHLTAEELELMCGGTAGESELLALVRMRRNRMHYWPTAFGDERAPRRFRPLDPEFLACFGLKPAAV